MKHIFFIVAIFCFGLKAKAQSNSRSQASDIVAEKLAKRMKDSLDLTGSQWKAVYEINLSLNSQKQEARVQLANNPLLGKKIQAIENKRDSMYNRVLPPEKYLSYIIRKQNIISGN